MDKIAIDPPEEKKSGTLFGFFPKIHPIEKLPPMLLEFMVLDIFEFLNQNIIFIKNINDATKACNK